MYLKRLEIVGFKSFADKIRLDFFPGVTGVVGPNGSGKSNISDALRWVLGEQSIKNLRGSKMDDIIFAGTEKRKPLSLAEVTIVLDNSERTAPLDFSEIMVTRKLFRSGESEYFINKSPVRLRDIQELFFDTGLGKDAYSVIGQGKIDAILSAKAEERRVIFEEAAGIMKYKSRKQVAERKLEETDRNLLRLRDIINEIETQIGPLEAQSNLAEQYLSLKEQLTRLEINHFGKLVDSLKANVMEVSELKAGVEEKYQDFEGQENIIDSQIEENRLQLLDQDNQINSFNEEYYRIQNQIDKAQEQINFFNSKIEDLGTQESEYQNNQQANHKRKEIILAEQNVINTEIVSIKEKLASHESGLAVEEQVVIAKNQELDSLENEEQNCKTEVIDLLNEIASLKNQVNSASLQKEFTIKQITDFRKRLDHLQKQLTEIEQEGQTKVENLTTTNQEIAQFHQGQAEQARKIIEFEEELSSVESKNLEWKDRIRGLESKMGLLEEMERSYQGYFQGVKAVLADAAGQAFYKGVRGIIADLIKVQPGMELAVETALGSSLQYIVIETDQLAQEAIEYLKRNSKGRATFLPMNMIQHNDNKLLQYQQLLQQYNCQPAISLLQFSPEYRSILNYLLNLTVVAPDLKLAIKAAAKLDKSFRIVTPEGDLVNSGGSITGGSFDKRRLGLLSRRKEIEDFKKDKLDSEAFLEKGIQNAKHIKEVIHNLAAELEAIKKRESESKLRKISLEREIQTLGQNMNRIKEEYDTYNSQYQELTVAGEQFDVGKEEYEKLIAEKEAALHIIESKLTELTAAIREAKQAKEEISQRITGLKSAISAAYQEENGKNALKEQLLRQIAEIDGFFGDIDQKQGQIECDRIRIKEAIAGLEEKIEKDKARLESQVSIINGGKQQKEEILLRIKDLETRQRSFRRRNNEFQNQLHKYDLVINQKKIEIENIENNLTEDYGSDWREKTDPSWESEVETHERIEELKGEIRNLGTVNLASIDDFRQVKQRYEFLSTQSEDLIKAKESLLKVIGEIERTITRRFTETFEEIRTHFKRLFAELFEGGSSDLFLLDDNLPLESGIEIIAQPPGKKLQSLSLLSGGERAMTAAALLFSILSVKPSPFCILDEIDATLDEVNVSRFAKLLELFSKQMQFIVVTHRRGTMEVSNALYGVTMEEMGVSKLISLDLNENINKKVG